MLTARDFKDLLPPEVKRFTIKVAVLFVLWEFFYTCILLPERFPDAFFTKITAAGTANLLAYIFPDQHFEYLTIIESDPISIKDTVFVDGNKLIGIADGCNAFELLVLYFGILICLERVQQKTLIYILIGLPLISLCNILRCAIIGWLNITQHLDLSVFAHHYLFKMIMYSMIFVAWVSYTNKKPQHG
jgi:exosortase/archaeosortase family protein